MYLCFLNTVTIIGLFFFHISLALLRCHLFFRGSVKCFLSLTLYVATKQFSLESALDLPSCLVKTMMAGTGAKVRHRPNCGGTPTTKIYSHTHTQNKTGTCNVLLSIVVGWKKNWSKMFCGTNQHPCHNKDNQWAAQISFTETIRQYRTVFSIPYFFLEICHLEI